MAIPFLLGLVTTGSCADQSDSVTWKVHPVPMGDRTTLEVSVQYGIPVGQSQKVYLPTDAYGTPDLDQYVLSFAGVDGTTVQPGAKPTERIVLPGPDGRVRLKYVISYDPQVMDGFSFAPNIGPTHFYVAGCQWLVRLGDSSSERLHKISIVDPPAGWRVYSSIGPDPRNLQVKATYDDLLTTAIGGGNGISKTFFVHSKPVFVQVQGSYDLSGEKILESVKKIVTAERTWFRDDSQPFYNIAILPRSGIVAGTCIPNQFVCFVKPDIRLQELNGLIAHEMFHTWLPNKLSIQGPKGSPDIRYEWLYEGFTEYFSRLILKEAGLLTQADFAQLVNRDIINLADNPHHGATLQELIDAGNSGTFGTAGKKLSYYRGAILALNWDAALRRSGKKKTLGDFIRSLYLEAEKSKGVLSEEAFFDFANRFGLPARRDFEASILRGEPILASPDALGPGFTFDDVEVRSFDPGFSIQSSFRERKVVGVVDGGAAHKAGLRNGLELVRMENSNRFGNGWQPQKPLIVVTKQEGRERKFEFMPDGPPLRVKNFGPLRKS